MKGDYTQKLFRCDWIPLPSPVEKSPHIQYCFPAMAAKYCPTCQKTYASTKRLCPDDGAVLSLNDPYHLVGRTLLGKYRIDALVGLGGMGAVYSAYHSGIDRRVAFKILQPNVALGDEHVVEMFEREAKLAGRLSHENIVDVKDAGHTDEGIAYIVMEWLEGRTLDDELAKEGRLSFSRSAEIARQIAAALGEAHGKHVIHRDLKPGNIMLIEAPDGRDHVKVLDFGIGKAIGETTASSPVSSVVGTPHYASPEQLNIGGNIDGRSDIYSLGIILYRMLGGKLPFNSSSMGEVIMMQLTSDPPSLSRLRPETPPAVERLINSMLAKDPGRRPQRVAEVVALLNQAFPRSEPHSRNDEKAPTGATTILRKSNLAERTTEEMPSPAPLQGKLSDNVQPAGRLKSAGVYAAIIVAALAAGVYGLYRYVSGGDAASDGRLERSQDLVAPSPSPSPPPSPTIAKVPPPLPAVADVRSPSPNPPAARPEPRTDRGLRDRAPDRPAAPDRSHPDNLRLADRHFERADELFRRGRYRAALAQCNLAIGFNPRHKDALELRRKISETIRILNPR